MNQKTPPLKLVEKPGSPADGVASARVLEVESLGQISRQERDRVEVLVKQLAPHSGILGVVRSERPGDLRPVVVMFGEGGPSIIRLLGADVVLSAESTTQIKDLFGRMAASQSLKSEFLAWGFFEGQIWYRRLLAERTLSDALAAGTLQSPEEIFALANTIVENLGRLHAQGISHGHLTVENISFESPTSISFLDHGVALAIVQAHQKYQSGKLPVGYESSSFAPEVVVSWSPSYASDLYGLGRILETLFLHLRKLYEGQRQGANASSVTLSDIQSLLSFCRLLCSEDIGRRPSLDVVRDVLVHRGRPVGVTEMLRPAVAQTIKRELAEPRVVVRNPNSSSGTHSVVREEAPAETSRAVTPTMYQPLSNSQLPSSVDLQSTNSASQDFYANNYSQPQPLELPRSLAEKAAASSSRSYVPNNSLLSWVVILGIPLLLLWFLFGRGSATTSTMSDLDLEYAWQSGIPSRMAIVAQLATDRNSPDTFAETLILKSAREDEQTIQGVNYPLLRIAYDQQWEQQLTPTDRRVALTLALLGILRGQASTDNVSLADLHPGVLLAIAATSGEQVARVLQVVPAQRLTELPAPLGLAFHELLQESPNLTCGDPLILQVAALATGMDATGESINTILRDDTDRRLRVLALLFSHDNTRARLMLDVLLKKTPAIADSPVVKWALAAGLSQWSELEPSDQLFVLAGVPPSASVDFKHRAALFAHPAPQMRAYAIDNTVGKVHLAHPGAGQVFRLLKQDPSILTGIQTAQLAAILENPSIVTRDRVQAWLATKPPVSIVAMLLLSTYEEKTATFLDFEFLRYLNENDWHPDALALQKLSVHPDSLTRGFAYREIFNRLDPKSAIELYERAMASEKDPEFKKQVRDNMQVLIESGKVGTPAATSETKPEQTTPAQ